MTKIRNWFKNFIIRFLDIQSLLRGEVKNGLTITKIDKADLKAGDVLVIEVNTGNLPKTKAEEYMQKVLPIVKGAVGDDVNVLILPNNNKITVVSK